MLAAHTSDCLRSAACGCGLRAWDCTKKLIHACSKRTYLRMAVCEAAAVGFGQQLSGRLVYGMYS